MVLRWAIFIAIYIAIDIYAFQAVRTVTKATWIHASYVIASVVILFAFIYQITYMGDSRIMSPGRMITFGLFLALIVPKLFILIVFMLGEDVTRLFIGLYHKIAGTEGFHVPSRRKFLSSIALGVAAVPFLSLIYGMYKGRYNYKVLRYTLEFDDLPATFDGFTLTQISDVHSGSFTNVEKVRYAIDLVNQQKSDVILFTGDLVNDVADEILPFKDIYSTLEAKDGIYSVLGNHDYGDYREWPSQEAKDKNFSDLKKLQAQMGWDLLTNEYRFLERNGERIALVGVENWGEGGFKKAGDLDRACEGLGANDFKILMSHDPSHWKAKVKHDDRNFQLTLSGHTHGMQFGIEIPGLIKWSPVKYRYENWAGIYEEFGRYINVNRGFGYIGYPGRVGIWPEITVIELKKRVNSA